MSLLEFLGCLIALVGGAWLGAIYMGIDVRHVAYVALTESELLEKVPEQWRPAAPAPKEATPSPAELAKAVQDELTELRQEVTALRAARGVARNELAGPLSDGSQPSDQNGAQPPAKEATLAFWNRVNDVVRGEAALQLDAESAATAGNATKVAALKGRISRFASSAIRAIPTDDVDPSAVQLGNDLARWYEHGGDLYDRAVRIWESPARGQTSPTLTKEWEQSRLQHHNEGRLLNNKVVAVRDSLTRRFGEGFTEFVGL